MKRRLPLTVAASLATLCAFLLAPYVGYQQARHAVLPENSPSVANASPTGNTLSISIDYPPQADTEKKAQATDAQTPSLADSLNQIWEVNAQQPLALRPEPLTEPNWTIGGVVQNGTNTSVMVQFQGESQVRFFKVGDVLPGGSKLAWVKPGAIGVVTPKQQKIEVPILEGNNPATTSPSPTKAAAKPGNATP